MVAKESLYVLRQREPRRPDASCDWKIRLEDQEVQTLLCYIVRASCRPEEERG